jgi:hypothetical protein
MRRTTTFAMIALLLTGLTACSPPSGDPHPTAAPPAVETPAPAVSTSPSPVPLIPSFLVVNAHSVSVGSTTQQSIVDVPYTTDPATAVDLLSDALEGAPVVSTIAATSCSAAATVWDWGGFRLVAPAPDGDRLGARFFARVTGAETVNGIDTELGYTDTVGSTLAAIVEHNAGTSDAVVSVDIGGGHVTAMTDGQDGNTWGVIIVVEGGVVHSYYAPGFFNEEDHC